MGGGTTTPARIAGHPAPPPFAYRNHGNLATIGRKSAVVVLDSIRLTGSLGWVFWCLAHVWYLIGFRSRIVVAFNWLWSYLTFQRGARLITGSTRLPTDGAPAQAAAEPEAMHIR